VTSEGSSTTLTRSPIWRGCWCEGVHMEYECWGVCVYKKFLPYIAKLNLTVPILTFKINIKYKHWKSYSFFVHSMMAITNIGLRARSHHSEKILEYKTNSVSNLIPAI
jgi:hypothetical protein